MDNFVAIPFDDSGTVFVNAMIEGADRVSIEQLAKGADVLFIYSGTNLLLPWNRYLHLLGPVIGPTFFQ